jgi:hypothetical protein
LKSKCEPNKLIKLILKLFSYLEFIWEYTQQEKAERAGIGTVGKPSFRRNSTIIVGDIQARAFLGRPWGTVMERMQQSVRGSRPE